MRKERGITLIALIITIVVLLILAVVAVTSIQKDDVIAYANNAASLYNQSVTNEQTVLNGYGNYLDDFSNGGGSETSCSHVWTWEYQYCEMPSVCTTCGLECTHTNGYSQRFVSQLNVQHYDCRQCNTCGQQFYEMLEDCNMVNNTCTLCGFTCAHSWINGICSVCGATCTHSWVANQWGRFRYE